MTIANKEICKRLGDTLPHDGPNWGSAASSHTQEWSIIGQQYLTKRIKQYPKEAARIESEQADWYALTKKQCEFGRDTTTYEDDDAEGEHPAHYDWVTYISCVYGETMDRVLTLHNKASK